MRMASYDLQLPPEDLDDIVGGDEEEERAARADELAQSLSLEDVQRLDSLRTLLDALLSPRTPLRSLQILTGISMPAATVLGCEQHLSGLTALELSTRFLLIGGAVVLEALQALLEQAPQVTALTVGLSRLGGPFPAFLAQRPWRQLHLSWNGFTALPASGAYLSGEAVLLLGLIARCSRCCTWRCWTDADRHLFNNNRSPSASGCLSAELEALTLTRLIQPACCLGGCHRPHLPHPAGHRCRKPGHVRSVGRMPSPQLAPPERGGLQPYQPPFFLSAEW